MSTLELPAGTTATRTAATGTAATGSAAAGVATAASLPSMRIADARAMGTSVRVAVFGDGPEPERAIDRIRELEGRWSRFIVDSELSRLNRAAGSPVVASHETALLVSLACDGARLSDGRFDPTVGPAVRAAGYDRDFDHLPRVVEVGDDVGPVRGVADVRVDLTSGLVWLPEGASIDPGGIGKGLAADLVAAEVVQAGATGVLVDVGGDLRVAGEPPPAGWEVVVDHDPHRRPWGLNLRSGAIVTSSVLGRRWRTTRGEHHHVIDPRTGRPSFGPAVSVSVVAPTAWWAEVVATALLVDPTPAELDGTARILDGAGALMTMADGRVLRLGPLADAFGHTMGRLKLPATSPINPEEVS